MSVFLFVFRRKSENGFMISERLDSSPLKKTEDLKRIIGHDNTIKMADKTDLLIILIDKNQANFCIKAVQL